MNSYARYALIIVLIGIFPISASGRSWSEAIRSVEARATVLWDLGLSLGGPLALGTALNEVDVDKHRCAILGRMLGHDRYIEHLEILEEPRLSSVPSEEEVFALMLFSQSLSNWALNAKNLVSESEYSRQTLWNLDCVGTQGIPAFLASRQSESSAKFRIEGSSLRVLGDIERNFASELRDMLLLNPNVTTVLLGSAGGSVVEALEAGRLIREKRLSTVLFGGCYSACPLVFLGGVTRDVLSPHPALGFHKIYNSSGAVPTDDPIYTAVILYVNDMGADPSFVLKSILTAEPEEMFEPQLQDLCDHGVVTWAQRIC